jgi:hypothetical protein
VVSELTQVTGLFDIARREASDRHPPAYYLDGAQWLLQADRELVVFCDPALAPRLRRRAGARTTIVECPLEELIPAGRVARIAAARERNPLRNASAIKDTPLYTAFTWAKFAMVARVVADGLGGDGPVAWIDIALAGRPHPDDDPFAAVADRIDLLMMRGFSAAEVADPGNFYAYLRGQVAAGYIPGSRRAWSALARASAERIETALAAGFAPSDEQLLAVLCADHPELFTFHHGGYAHILSNFVHLRGSANNLAYQLHEARAAREQERDERWVGPSGFELAARVVESIDAGLLSGRGQPFAALLDECFMAAWYANPGDAAPAAHVRDLYLDEVRRDHEFRDAFLLSEIRVRGNFAYVGGVDG